MVICEYLQGVYKGVIYCLVLLFKASSCPFMIATYILFYFVIIFLKL